MKILKHLLLTAAVMICFSMATPAQDKNKQPKKDPPVVPVKEKDKPKEDKPKNDKDKDQVKKPPTEFYLSENRIVINLV